MTEIEISPGNISRPKSKRVTYSLSLFVTMVAIFVAIIWLYRFVDIAPIVILPIGAFVLYCVTEFALTGMWLYWDLKGAEKIRFSDGAIIQSRKIYGVWFNKEMPISKISDLKVKQHDDWHLLSPGDWHLKSSGEPKNSCVEVSDKNRVVLRLGYPSLALEADHLLDILKSTLAGYR